MENQLTIEKEQTMEYDSYCKALPGLSSIEWQIMLSSTGLALNFMLAFNDVFLFPGAFS